MKASLVFIIREWHGRRFWINGQGSAGTDVPRRSKDQASNEWMDPRPSPTPTPDQDVRRPTLTPLFLRLLPPLHFTSLYLVFDSINLNFPFLSLLTMSSQRYERVRPASIAAAALPRNPQSMITILTSLQVSNNEEDDTRMSVIPSSPPPSFRSVASSPVSRHFPNDSSVTVDQNLADTFDADGSDSDEDNDGDDRQRLMRGTSSSSTPTEQTYTPASSTTTAPPRIERRATYLPVFAPQPTSGRIVGGGSGSDGVFSNLSAKPEAGEKLEEHPPVSCHIAGFTNSFHTNA
jgi:hypothetical protein